MKSRLLLALLALMSLFAVGANAKADSQSPVMIQYFEAEWDTIRYRMPDVFMAGYDGLWLPPPQRAAGGTNGIGYDLFDRFDLGSEADPTRYGSESGFRLMIEQSHRANCRVFVDWLMNHNAAWDNDSGGDPFLNNGQDFIENGGYPGFLLEVGGDSYGDFHTKGTQSEDPGGANYDLFEGRLLGLIDIDQYKNHQYIRHPVTSHPDNLPMPGSAVRNQPNPDNYRLYPDMSLGGYSPSNPGTNGRWPSTGTPPSLTFYPYNTSDSMAGDPVTENATGLLMRSSMYYLEVLGVDGFRLDAAKHIPPGFWDNYWDACVHNRYVGFDGVSGHPYSFVEAVEGPANILNWVRKPNDTGSSGWPTSPSGTWNFGNRDALEINEAGDLRNIVGNPSWVHWDDIMYNNVDDEDDGLNNGSVGVHHVTSHDNSFGYGDGTDDSMAQAYVLMRTGSAVVYHNPLQFGYGDFPRPSSRLDALGLGSDRMTTLVNLRNQYGRGWFVPLYSSSSKLVFTRRSPGGSNEDNVLVALNDLHSTGYDTISISTHFPQGTRLHELTGNAAASGGTIPEIVTVGSGGSLSSFRIPRSVDAQSGDGYVVYGPAVPSGTVSIVNADTTMLPPDMVGTPDYIQRLTSVTMVKSATFDILLQTTQTDPSDGNTDDFAVFRIDNGFVDYNGVGLTDTSDYHPGNSGWSDPSYGFETFQTESSPLYGGGTGLYRQTIQASDLSEGYHYITVRAYRHRNADSDPLFGEFRIVIYLDAEDPDFILVSPTATCDNDITTMPVEFIVHASDDTIEEVHIFVDFKPETDFITLAEQSGTYKADRYFNTYTVTKAGMLSGNHRVDVVAVEDLPDGSQRYSHKSYTGIQATTGSGLGAGDTNHNGVIDESDIFPFVYWLTTASSSFRPAVDMNCDGYMNGLDIQLFVEVLTSGS